MESDLHSHRIRLFVPWECELLNCSIIPVYLLYESIIFIILMILNFTTRFYRLPEVEIGSITLILG